ncbi:MAG: prepilin peptidase [Pseudomonadota bacterium]
MSLDILPATALWFLPFALPICLWVMWSDLKAMKIPNTAVLSLVAVFVVVGLLALPFETYLWRLLTMVIVLVITFFANVIRLMGAGDSKFIAAAAPFIDHGDGWALAFIFAANLLACYVTHRIAKNTSLRQLAPEWDSWTRGRKFPMGFALGGTLIIYLGLGAFTG